MTMKQILTVVAAAAFVLPAAANAQSTVNASATVANYDALSGTGDLAFSVTRAAGGSIDATAGTVVRTLDFNHNVTVSFTGVPTNLTATVNSQSVSLPVSITCASKLGAAAWTAAAACVSKDLDVGTTQTSALLGFGGTISAAAVQAAPAATYNGSFTIVITAR
jgi:hypothetical protein